MLATAYDALQHGATCCDIRCTSLAHSPPELHWRPKPSISTASSSPSGTYCTAAPFDARIGLIVVPTVGAGRRHRPTQACERPYRRGGRPPADETLGCDRIRRRQKGDELCGAALRRLLTCESVPRNARTPRAAAAAGTGSSMNGSTSVSRAAAVIASSARRARRGIAGLAKPPATSAPGLHMPPPHLRRDRAHPATSAPGPGSTLGRGCAACWLARGGERMAQAWNGTERARRRLRARSALRRPR